MKVSALEVGGVFGKSRKTITNWLNENPPCPSDLENGDRVFITQDVARWLEERAARRALEKQPKKKPEGTEELQLRRLQAETELAEHNLRVALESVIPLDAHKAVARDHAGRIRAVLINLPSNYTLTLERAGVPAEAAQATLEEIAQDITRALRATADEMRLDDD